MFQVGDQIVHPGYGVGTVIEIKKSHTLGREKRYYSIELLNEHRTVVMVPVGAEERFGLRRPISEAKLRRVWRILKDDPKQLPGNYGKRCELLDEKLASGDALKIAGAVRDLAWRRENVRKLTIHGKRLYDRGMAFLAGEVASVKDSDFVDAEILIMRMLDQGLYPAT
jgi:RNA polymerase-interacting CarD/CdnL/TRCF family regulator